MGTRTFCPISYLKSCHLLFSRYFLVRSAISKRDSPLRSPPNTLLYVDSTVIPSTTTLLGSFACFHTFSNTGYPTVVISHHLASASLHRLISAPSSACPSHINSVLGSRAVRHDTTVNTNREQRHHGPRSYRLSHPLLRQRLSPKNHPIPPKRQPAHPHPPLLRHSQHRHLPQPLNPLHRPRPPPLPLAHTLAPGLPPRHRPRVRRRPPFAPGHQQAALLYHVRRGV